MFFILSMLGTDDREFLLSIYNDYYARMRWTIRNILGNDQDMEDLINDTLLRLIPRLDLLRRLTPGQLSKYVRMTAKTAALRHRQKKSREAAVSPDLLDANMDDSESPEDAAIQQEEHTTIKELVSRLPERDRDILYFFYVLELPAEEIGGLMGMSADNVWQRLSRARRKIRRSWEANGNE